MEKNETSTDTQWRVGSQIVSCSRTRPHFAAPECHFEARETPAAERLTGQADSEDDSYICDKLLRSIHPILHCNRPITKRMRSKALICSSKMKRFPPSSDANLATEEGTGGASILKGLSITMANLV